MITPEPKQLTEKEVENRKRTDRLHPTDESTLRNLKRFLDRYPHPDIADIGGAGYEQNIIPFIGEVFDVYDPFYDAEFDICARPLPRKYQTIICLNTYEHLYNPFSASENIIKSLESGGFLFTSTPYMFHQHDYEHVPDYFRYTDTAMKHLLRDLEYVEHWYDFDHAEVDYGGPYAALHPSNRLNYVAVKK